MRYLLLLLTVCYFMVNSAATHAAQVTIAFQGKSTFSIILPQNAPSSVTAAAQEMQKDVQISTGAKLPIVKDDSAKIANFISLGATKQAQQAGISATRIAPEGFRIVTRNGNIFILGPDTADGAFTDEGGTSNGTANGVYSFLEKYLGVRWLMPGDLGRDVPLKSTFYISDTDYQDSPFLINRREPYIQNEKPAVQEWEAQQKLGYSFRINHGHNWIQTITPDYYEKHPEWFAMRNGKRVAPKGNYKLETTDPQVVQFFADKAIADLKAHPEMNTFSLSPSDGRGWSESPESKAWYDPVPPLHTTPSITPLILKFYHDVAQIVTRKMPNAKLAGYIYSDYLYPPHKGGMTLPNNFYPVIAPSIDYGYKLYRPDVQQNFNDLLAEWSKVTPHLFYYDLPNRLRQSSGLITPMAPEIFNFIFPRLVKDNVKGAYIYGIDTWSQAAISNYVLAKMMWNPHLDAYQLQREWLQRAYGKSAGAKMEVLYHHLDKWFSDYYKNNHEASYVLTLPMLKGMYAAHYPELETLFLQAEKQQMSPVQKQRLQLIKDNLVILQWRLNNLHLLPANFKPALPATSHDVAQILAIQNPAFNNFPGILPDNGKDVPQLRNFKVQKVNIVKSLPAGESTFALPNANTFLIHAARDGKISLLPRDVQHSDWVVTYILKNKNAPGEIVSSGMLAAGQAITFNAQAGQNYFLSLPPYNYISPRSGLGYEIEINGAEIAKSTFDAAHHTLYFQNADAPVYVYGNPKSLVSTSSGVTITNASPFNVLQHQYTDVKSLNLTSSWHFLPDAAAGKNVESVTFDDSAWKTIDAGNWWQRLGYTDYHGKAWYRKTITLPALSVNQKAVLQFDAVDGNAEVFVNGKKVGEHILASDYTGWDEPFHFDITNEVKPGKNVIAVQVASKSQDTASGINQPVHLLVGTPR
jgi:hypothetical protein